MNNPTFPLLATSRLRMEIDGDGVTTLVAGAGCPLRCKYCINQGLLRRVPRVVTPQELYDRVKRDDLYFRATGGGICFGGGEALLHTDFYAAFRALIPSQWRLTAETSLHVPRANVESAAGTIDHFIVDLKDCNPEIYRSYTGGSAALALENLEHLLTLVGPDRLLVRLPLIPGYNTREDQARSVARLRQMGIQRLDCFSYVVRPAT